MASYETRRWEPSFGALSRSARQSGTYRAYVPDPLVGRPLVVDAALDAHCARAEAAVRGLAVAPGTPALEGLARFLLRSEALASSRIEGLQVSPQQLALVELADAENIPIRGFSENARLVANNISVLRRAGEELAAASTVTVASLTGIHRALLPDHHPAGLRTVQNWIGGNSWHPIGSDFVPPPPEHVEPLMRDLAEYMSGAGHSALVQAALVHAQFETIHPFTDGNGRVGRALIHSVLTRRGLTRAAVLPVSLVLLTRSEEYAAGMTAYRYDGDQSGRGVQNGLNAWLEVFLEAVEVAVGQASEFADQVAALRGEWEERYLRFRQTSGRQRPPRSNAASVRLLAMLPEVPLVTARTVERLLGVSFTAARTSLEELTAAGVLTRRQVARNTTGYLANDVFELLTVAERRLASTKWDTRDSPPRRPVPALPQV